jgi:membrane fusion protein, copper/silver efflux system
VIKVKSDLIRFFKRMMRFEACYIGKGYRLGFFAPFRMTRDRRLRAQGARRKANFISQISDLSPSGLPSRSSIRAKAGGGRGRWLDCVGLFAIFISIAVLISPNAFSQDSMQNMPGMAESTKSKDAQPAAQQAEPEQEVPKVELEPEQVQLIGVKTVKASYMPMTRVIRTVGRIETNERSMATVNTKIEGWVEKLYVDYTGMYVKKDEPMAEIYSPDLLATQMEFINTLKWTSSGAGSEKHADKTSSADSISGLQEMLQKDAAATQDAARQRLRLWDMSEEQIAQVEATGKPIRTITVYSPISGTVMQKMAVLGTKVMPGEKLFDLADLSSLWIIADIYEYELPFVKAGQEAKITLSYMPGSELTSRIDFIYPSITEDSRTAKVRFFVPNPGQQLKPQMYTNIDISVNQGNRLCIPESAVIDTGVRQVVYADLGGGAFEPKEVKLGLRVNGHAEVLQGLKEGDSVAYSANFLIDSEAQLEGVKPLSSK